MRATPGAGARGRLAAGTGVVDRLRRRVREPGFWAVQATVVAVTVLHGVVESAGLLEAHDGPLAPLAHLPVTLYVVPVVYGGLRYGLEGGGLTGALALALAVPNMALWHQRDFAWVGELASVLVVVGFGVLMGIPVTRERRERAKAEAATRRAEVTSHRLALLNEVAFALVSSTELEGSLRGVLELLVQELPLEAAALTPHDGDALGLEAITVGDAAAPDAPPPLRVPLRLGDARSGELAVSVRPGAALALADRDLLHLVAAQVSIALDNARLDRLDRERMRTYVQEVTRAQEEERRLIARDLHDVATHELLLLCRGLDALCDGGDLPAATRVKELREQAGGVVDYLRRFTRDLRPTIVDNLGLAPALHWLATEFAGRGDVEVTVDLPPPSARAPAEVEIALFRVAQEALRNVERHARAGRVAVRLTRVGGGLELEIADDGTGFAVPDRLDAIAASGQLGLLGMHERVQLVRGTVSVRSAPGRGTSVRAVVPA